MKNWYETWKKRYRTITAYHEAAATDFSPRTRIRNKLQWFSSPVLIRNLALVAAQNYTFTMAEMISKVARMKAEEKKVDLPGGVIVTSFDPARSEFVVTFSNNIENAI